MFKIYFPENNAVYEITWENMVQQYGASAFHAGRLKPPTRTQNM
jgi:hypothetical protein